MNHKNFFGSIISVDSNSKNLLWYVFSFFFRNFGNINKRYSYIFSVILALQRDQSKGKGGKKSVKKVYSQLSISMWHNCRSIGKYCKFIGHEAVIVSLKQRRYQIKDDACLVFILHDGREWKRWNQREEIKIFFFGGDVQPTAVWKCMPYTPCDVGSVLWDFYAFRHTAEEIWILSALHTLAYHTTHIVYVFIDIVQQQPTTSSNL